VWISPNNEQHRGHWLLANINSFAFDYQARQVLNGTHLTFSIITQLPFVPPFQYNEMAESVRSGNRYQTFLDPPPADPKATHKELP
jgi:hypothetical protein